MSAKVKPQSKETFSHWTVIATFAIIVAIIISFPCIPKAPEQKQLPEPSASFTEATIPAEELIPPPIMRQTIDLDNSKLKILMPQKPTLPTTVPYIPLEAPFLGVADKEIATTTNQPSTLQNKENSN